MSGTSEKCEQTFKCTNVYVMGVPGDGEGSRRVFKEIIAYLNSPNLLEFPTHQRSLMNYKQDKSKEIHTSTQDSKNIEREKQEEKNDCHINPKGLSADFSSATVKVRGPWDDIVSC